MATATRSKKKAGKPPQSESGESLDGDGSATTAAENEPSDADILAEIRNAELKCIESEAVMESRKQDLKIAKELHDGNVGTLRSLCRAAYNDENRPLLNKSPGDDASED